MNKHYLISYITAKLDSLSEQNLKTIYFMVRLLIGDYTTEKKTETHK